MSKYRFREYDALGLRSGRPARPAGDQPVSKHHVSKRKLKSQDVEVEFDQKGYKEYVTGFRKRKQQRRQVALKQIEDKQRVARNQQRSERKTKLKEELGFGDDYGVALSSDGEDEEDAPKPQNVTVYRGDDGLTTTVTTLAVQSSDDEAAPTSGSGSEGEGQKEERGGGSGGARAGRGAGAAGRGAGRGGKGSTRGKSQSGGGKRPRAAQPGDALKVRKLQKRGGGGKRGGR